MLKRKTEKSQASRGKSRKTYRDFKTAMYPVTVAEKCLNIRMERRRLEMFPLARRRFGYEFLCYRNEKIKK